MTESSGDLVKVALSSANRSGATVIAKGLTQPQQMFLDEAHNAIYVVVHPGSLLRFNLTGPGSTVVIATLDNPIGLVLSSDLQYAYVSEQTTTPDLGRISQIKLSGPTRTTLAKGLTNPFHLTWADAAQDSLLVPLRDPSNSIISVNVTTGATTLVAGGVPVRPSSVCLPYSGQMLICSDSVIEEIDFLGFTGDLLMGIGLIPATDVAGGLATTPAGLYQVTNAPFGGTLPIMVNYQAAITAGASYYQVQVDGIPQTDIWSVYFGDPAVLISVPALTIGPSTGCYPVHPVAELFQYNPPELGDQLDSTRFSNGLHKLVLVFLDSGGKPLSPTVESLPLNIMVNNQQCVAALSPPSIPSPGSVDSACGVIHYAGDKTLTVSLAFTATQPANFATFSLALLRGGGPAGFTLPSGPVTAAPAASPIKPTVSDLLGSSCPTAGFAAELYVAATMTNGWNRQSQYDGEDLRGFALTP